jgi:hypothetical protein
MYICPCAQGTEEERKGKSPSDMYLKIRLS